MAVNRKKERRVLAVASGGGHWVQLLRLRPAFEGASLLYVTTRAPSTRDMVGSTVRVVPDGNMDSKLSLILTALHMAYHIARFRPHVVVSTGAAPGFIALVFGKLIGSRTIWLDSVANSESLSLAGRKVRRWADHWLTQWPELATPEGPHYVGAVL
ncbi:hypothetical protein [Stenotrophomonas maltophilia]|uniref:hypothetical protein n=1 Tax=Stenotrophomonas maltophilia TaxID=40324 RepID=UPI003D189073